MHRLIAGPHAGTDRDSRSVSHEVRESRGGHRDPPMVSAASQIAQAIVNFSVVECPRNQFEKLSSKEGGFLFSDALSVPELPTDLSPEWPKSPPSLFVENLDGEGRQHFRLL